MAPPLCLDTDEVDVAHEKEEGEIGPIDRYERALMALDEPDVSRREETGMAGSSQGSRSQSFLPVRL